METRGDDRYFAVNGNAGASVEQWRNSAQASVAWAQEARKDAELQRRRELRWLVAKAAVLVLAAAVVLVMLVTW
jgi:Tfp pilus assembly protein PilN